MQRALITLVLLVAVLRLVAQTWEVFDMATAGFPSNTVLGSAEDGAGNTWLATDWGLYKYDGATWTIFQTTNSGLTDDVLHAVAVDTLDRVWLGTQTHGVVMYDGISWTEYNMLNSPIPNDDINCVTVDHRNWVWIGTSSGLACYTGVDWRIYDASPSSYNGLVLNGPNIQDVDVRPDGLVAIGTLNYGFHYLTDTSVTVHATYIDLFPDNTQLSVAFDEVNDERWLATPSQGLIRQGGSWVNGPWFQYTTLNSTIPTDGLTEVDVDDAGGVWVGTVASGLVLRQLNGSFVQYSTANSDLPDDWIQDVRVAGDGSIWVCTYFGGAARLSWPTGMASNSTTSHFSVFPNPASGSVFVDLEDRPERVTWRLLDAAGRCVLQGGGNGGERMAIQLPGTLSGAFQLVLSDGLQRWSKPLVIL